MNDSAPPETSAPTRRAAIHTLGCRLNQGETRLLEDQLRRAGYELVPFDAPADLGVIHTCVVTREAEAKSRKMIQRFIRANPGARVAVIGCYAQTGADALANLPGVHLVLGNAAKLDLTTQLLALDNAEKQVDVTRPKRGMFTVPFETDGPPIVRRVNVKIQDGCDFMCRYCYIPFARGRSRSRELNDILAEAAALAARGAQELVLTGVNIGDYRDGGHDLVQLVDRLNEQVPKLRLRISSLELTNTPEALLPRMADPEHILVPHLHIPLQSGSANILAAMGRPYAPEAYLSFLQRAAQIVPDIALGADVMVGFPGESETDFEATRTLIAESPLTYLHVFQYSERPEVASAHLPNKVAPETMRQRSQILLQLDQEKRRVFLERWPGRHVDVLFESNDEGLWVGHTPNYLEVHVPSTESLQNKCACVHIESLCEQHLLGRLA